MESTFSIGVSSRKSRTQRLIERRIRQKRAEVNRRKAQRPRRRRVSNQLIMSHSYLYIVNNGIGITYTFSIRDKNWLILHDVPQDMQFLIHCAGENITAIMENLRQKRRIYKNQAPFLNACRLVIIKNQRIRVAFENLARRWIRSRIRPGNEEDLMTGEIPSNPIVLIDWGARRSYMFEPSTIYRDILTRLQMSYCAVFPKPMSPRNPYTNMDMTMGQVLSVVKQLRRRGMTHWTIEALYSVQCNMKQFEYEMFYKLKQNLVKNIFTSYTSADSIELTLEFIEDQHTEHDQIYERSLYSWAIRNIPTHPLLCAWRTLAYQWHRVVHVPNSGPILDSISEGSRHLCRFPKEIVTAQERILGSETSSTDSL